jgi:hypothetical protein
MVALSPIGEAAMPATLKRNSPHPAVPATEPVVANPSAKPAVTPAAERPYRGDSLGLWIWICGALLLVVLHITEPIYYWLRR